MITISAVIQWHRDGADFGSQRYSRAHTWHFDGGTSVAASSSPDIVPLPWSDASAVDPEEAFVAAISSCHMLWFLSIASAAGFSIDQYTDKATGELGNGADGKPMISRVELHPDIVWSGDHRPTDAEIDLLHQQAHQECFIANSVHTEVAVRVP